MPDILVRGVTHVTLERLKARADRHGRSLQSEAKILLEQAAGASGEELAALFGAWRKRFAGRRFCDSADLIREDRGR
ncbi:MAG: hypothetical protein A2W31_14320 [Planctomycetes bacterium RBG_16_64_10]|nr:MAG: hypothetical protein A2W31_14320 [Planctomycetes bacterium RBG_16_64_10]